MRTGNPALNENVFKADAFPGDYSSTMTLGGTVAKTAALLVVLVGAGVFSWTQTVDAGGGLSPIYSIAAPIAGLILAMITIFKPNVSPYTSPFYAAAQGLFLGAISSVFEAAYQGIVFQAVLLTVGVLVALLMAYTSGLIKATENFKLGVIAATGGIFLVYLATMVLSFFNVQIPYIHGSGWIGIGFSLFVVVIAALNLVLDFDFIEQGVARGAPKYMEWYGAFGLLVTLVWLYIEILRLLAKLRGRD